MAKWQLTATTIHCDAVDDDVTIIVRNDLSTTCTGYSKYVEKLNSQTAGSLNKKSNKSGKTLKCEGLMDYRVINYRDKVASEGN